MEYRVMILAMFNFIGILPSNCTITTFTPGPTFTPATKTTPNTSESSVTICPNTTSHLTSATSTTSPTTTPATSTSSATSPTTFTIKIHWALVVIGGVIVAILFIAVITCMIFTGLVAKGVKVLIQYLSDSGRANGEYDIQPQQQQPQKEVSRIQYPTRCHTSEPQYDSIENEQAPVHYFELEPPPQHINTKAKLQRKPISKSQGIAATAKLSTLEEGYNSPISPGYTIEYLPPSIKLNSGTCTQEITVQEKAKEQVPIYSMPDKTKKSTKMKLEPMEQDEGEATEQLSCSHALDSFFHIKSQIKVEEGSEKTTRLGSSSPPPPLLPPKPGQKSKLQEDDGENEESVYAEASSIPLQVRSQRKINDEWSDTAKHKTATEMGNISPFHLHARYYQKEQGHIHNRSLSAADHMKREEAHYRLVAKTEHDQLYDTALSLMESKEGEEEKLRVQLLKKEEGINMMK